MAIHQRPLLSLVAVVLILAPGPMRAPWFYFAATIASAPMVGFLMASVRLRLHGGALSVPNGIPPLKVKCRGSELRIDLNLIAQVAALPLIVVAVALFRA